MQDFDLQNQLIQNRLRNFQSQGYQQPQGQMVGRHFVAPNALQHIAAGLRGYGAIKGEQQATQELKDLSTQRQNAMANAVRNYNNLMTGTPEVPEKSETFGSEEGDFKMVTQPFQAARAPDPVRAAGALIESGIPSLQTAGLNMQMETQRANAAEARAQAGLARNRELWQKSGGDVQQFINLGGDIGMAKTLAEIPTIGKVKPVVVGDSLVNPQTGEVVYRVPEKINMNNPIIPDGKGGFKVNDLYVEAKGKIAAQGRPVTQAPKTADAGWKYDAGSDTWVKPPSAQFPMGQSTPNVGKLASASNFDYLSKSMVGEDNKSGILARTAQGGYFGLGGALGSGTQAAKEFDNTVEQMSTELRTIFRIPGEGALSDKEQAQYGIQLPKRGNDAALNRKIIQDLNFRIQNKVNPQGVNPFNPEPQLPPGRTPTAAPIYATDGKQRIVSTDGGKTWQPAK